MKKVVCEQCEGKGHIKVEDVAEYESSKEFNGYIVFFDKPEENFRPCNACKAMGFIIYIEEDEAFGSDCIGGRCEV
jgi:hypothetical protein